jgi:integrase
MQKHTIKLVLRKDKKNKQGHPIYIRITIDRKSSFISTGYYIHKTLWDERNERVKDSHPSAEKINEDIVIKKNEVLDNMIDATREKNIVTAAVIKERSLLGKERTNIFSFAEKFAKDLEGKRAGGTIKNWEFHLKKLEDFNGGRELDFEHITKDYLTNFEAHLRGGSVKRVNGSNPNNYIAAIMVTIRILFNAAIKAELITCYPFRLYEVPMQTPGKKARLTLVELDRWEQLCKETKVSRFAEAGYWFLFGSYTGLRVSDWHNFNFSENIHHDYISVQAIKNKESVALPLHTRLIRILAIVKDIPLKKDRHELNRIYKEIGKELKLKKRISTHCARHTFAITMCAERGIPSETCAKLMGITPVICIESYYRVTPEKIRYETEAAWEGI